MEPRSRSSLTMLSMELPAVKVTRELMVTKLLSMGQDLEDLMGRRVAEGDSAQRT